MSIKGSTGAERDRGPGWYDVAFYTSDLQKQHEDVVCIQTLRSGLKSQYWGFRVEAWFQSRPECRGYGCYGPAHPGNGQATMAGAYYRALLTLDIAASSMFVQDRDLFQSDLDLEQS